MALAGAERYSSVPAATASKATKASAKKPAAAKAKTSNSPSAGKGLPRKARKPASLPKSDGDAGVQAYIASMEPWQAAIAKRVDALVVKHVPGVRKAVRWHGPFYGVEGQGWFLAFAAFQHHVKFSFFKGASLKPVPPIGQFKDVRSLDVRESDKLDETQLPTRIEQAASIPGWPQRRQRRQGRRTHGEPFSPPRELRSEARLTEPPRPRPWGLRHFLAVFPGVCGRVGVVSAGTPDPRA